MLTCAALGGAGDGSKANPVHFINVLDEDGDKISPDDDPQLPFSTRTTCGTCHSYETIADGWHFNSMNADAAAGRTGQPWIYTDAETAVQIPVSYRDWPGVFKPQELGLKAWDFALLFGRQMAGGIEEGGQEFNPRWLVSGELQINCLSCHNGHAGQDQAEYASQIARQNFRWAATAACEFASGEGSAKDMPDTFDHLMPDILDDPKLVAPAVSYRKEAFGHKNKVLFDVGREVRKERCYFCHSTVIVADEESAKVEDVHLASGLTCVDCHSEGIGHNTIRGYEGEAGEQSAEYSCKGCHLPDKSIEVPTAGRFGAPEPKHIGIPLVHFERLTCTACHSGPWPGSKAYNVKTSRSHGLGTRGSKRTAQALPHLQSPVFAKGWEEKIGPHNLIWPAFWGYLDAGKVRPVGIETVKAAIRDVLADNKAKRSGDWPELTEEKIQRCLVLLAGKVMGQPVYICGGKIYQMDADGKLCEDEHEAAEPVLWPIAHNVRPAQQSLGIGGCGDCHAIDKPFMFGSVAVDSPLADDGTVREMSEFEGLDSLYAKLFAFTFVFRLWFKLVSIGACMVITAVLLVCGSKGLAFILGELSGKDKET